MGEFGKRLQSWHSGLLVARWERVRCVVLKQACRHRVAVGGWCGHHPRCGHRSMARHGLPPHPCWRRELGAPAALRHGSLCSCIWGERLSPRVSSHPVPGGKAAVQPGAPVLYSLGSGGRLIYHGNTLTGVLVLLKLWR